MPGSKDTWEKIRQRGRNHFVWFRGALGWGVPTALLWLFFMWFFMPGFDMVVATPIALVLFPIGGLAWGWFMWWFLERGHAKRANRA